MERVRVTPPMNSQKPGRARGQRAVVVDMSKITPAAPPCITSGGVLGGKRVGIGKSGRRGLAI